MRERENRRERERTGGRVGKRKRTSERRRYVSRRERARARKREKGAYSVRGRRRDPQSRHVSLAMLYAARLLPCFTLVPSFSLSTRSPCPSFSHRREPARFSASPLSLSRLLSVPGVPFPTASFSSSRPRYSFFLAHGRRCVLPLVSWFLSARARSFNTP